jgi:hypothetical protein
MELQCLDYKEVDNLCVTVFASSKNEAKTIFGKSLPFGSRFKKKFFCNPKTDEP